MNMNRIKRLLTAIAVILGLFALAVTAARRGGCGRIVMCATALATGFAYYALLYYANAAALNGRLPAAAGWLANAVFLALALLLFRLPHGELAEQREGRL